MDQPIWKGIWAIPVAPFDRNLALVWDEVASQVDFAVGAGAHGIVGPIIASEVYTLSDSERRRYFETVADALRGRLPFIAGVSGNSAPHALELAAMAQEAGATGLITMAPMVGTRSAESATKYFERFLNAVSLPVVLQNAPPQFSPPIPLERLATIAADHQHVVGIKEESGRSPQGMGHLVKMLKRPEVSVFGGFGGLHFLNELARGVRGTMVACEFTDVMARVFACHEAGNLDECREVFAAVQPALVMESAYGMEFAKQCLKRRGVIRNTYSRESYPKIDEVDEALLEGIWANISPYFQSNQATAY
ncbi:dihydrodipicolinate synthase family protein [Halovulum sp. GXIMD14794]